MHGPASPGWLLVALCAVTGGYCLLRMRSAVEEQRRAAGGEALMGFGTAVMAVPAAVVAPPRWAWLAYTVVFGAAALRALWAARTGPRHHLHHLVGALAMVYMAAAMAFSPGGGHGGTGLPLVTGVLLLYFGGYVLWAGVRLLPVPAAAGARVPSTAPVLRTVGWGDRPELSRACRLSMGIGMFAMLLTV
ncbi:DUF5134 domain-containing protein [Streptomyces ipomoeae]|nr:DUF5134 domain-containing protein [Streptomyces ipomoeae]MDX2695840.1 DUF5134 domain-containing protein [Streptomyces ipomoeae]MDX2823642.1 DUF5134 domain-containing protein [Streptomyces ipomoeae]MDX2839007.1 DUF5134 domain-containing protein [Streptomyces ipomoeae]MDX2873587.1 DUF5134 domain-containing protein [Streptomyces ipomoeae]TQE35521.1 DUF5134 domain-containing protein [Streptomyces ipomoeae]